jgi:ribosomal protein S26
MQIGKKAAKDLKNIQILFSYKIYKFYLVIKYTVAVICIIKKISSQFFNQFF